MRPVLCLIILLLAAAAALGQQPIRPAEWQRYEFDHGQLSVLLPDKPVESVGPVQPSEGMTSQTTDYEVSTENGLYLIGVSVLTPSPDTWTAAMKQEFLDALWGGISKGMDDQLQKAGSSLRTTLMGTTDTTIGTLPGHQLEFTLGKSHGYFRSVLLADRSYSVLYLSNAESASDRDRFFNSITYSGGSPAPKQ